MYRNSEERNMSELEKEFELEMDDQYEAFEADEDSEYEEEPENEYEEDYENFADDDETIEDSEYEAREDDYEWLTTGNSDYAERFYELSQREFESETEIDESVNEILDDMEREYFFGGLLDKAKNAVKKLAKKGVALAEKNLGIKLPSLDALKSMLGPAADLLKGNLGSLIKPALKAALMASPAGMAALPALNALGFESGEDMSENREAWNNYAAVVREAFEHLAANVSENADHPLEASRLAANAFQAGLKKMPARTRAMSYGKHFGRPRSGGHGDKRVRRVYLAPGEILVIKRKP